MHPLLNTFWFSCGYYFYLYIRGLFPIYIRHRFAFLQRLTRAPMMVALPYLIIWSLYRIPESQFYWRWVLMWWTGVSAACGWHTLTCMYSRPSQRKYIAPIVCAGMLFLQVSIASMRYW